MIRHVIHFLPAVVVARHGYVQSIVDDEHCSVLSTQIDQSFGPVEEFAVGQTLLA